MAFARRCTAFSEWTPHLGHAGLRGPAALAKRVDTGEAGRWRRFTREQIAQRGDSLDISWLKDDSAETTQQQGEEPALVARLALRELKAAVIELRALLEELGEDPDAALEELLVDEAPVDEAAESPQ